MTRPAREVDSIEIQVNGEMRKLKRGCCVLDVLEELDLHPQTVAVEYNGSILKRADYGSAVLQPADRLELVRFVQGGGWFG